MLRAVNVAGWFGCLLKLIGDRTGLRLVTLARGGQGRGEEKVRERECVRKMEGTRIKQERERGGRKKKKRGREEEREKNIEVEQSEDCISGKRVAM